LFCLDDVNIDSILTEAKSEVTNNKVLQDSPEF